MKDEGAETLEKDEIVDIVTNYLACQSSVTNKTIEKVEKIIKDYCSDPGIESEKHYEFFFNLSQIYMKDDDPEQSLFYLRQAFKKASTDNQIMDDQNDLNNV